MFTIETNVPIPVNGGKTSSTFDPIYEACKSLVKGQSFAIPVTKKPGLKNPALNMQYNIRKFVKGLGNYEFLVKMLDEDTVRVWCLESPVIAPAENVETKGDAPKDEAPKDNKPKGK